MDTSTTETPEEPDLGTQLVKVLGHAVQIGTARTHLQAAVDHVHQAMATTPFNEHLIQSLRQYSDGLGSLVRHHDILIQTLKLEAEKAAKDADQT